MSNLTRATIDALWPKGAAWRPVPGGDLDNLLEALADNWELIRSEGQSVADVRDPYRTTMLADLEREFGILPSPYLTETQRRSNLADRKFSKKTDTLASLQAALDANGFGTGGYGLQAYDNNGGANPQLFVAGGPASWAGGTNSVAGNTSAYAGASGGGQLIVNAPNYQNLPGYLGAGTTNAVAGNNAAVAGYYVSLIQIQSPYGIPADSGYWRSFIFLAKSPTYSSGAITDLGWVSIPASRRDELIDLVCRIKPMAIWAVAYITWT